MMVEATRPAPAALEAAEHLIRRGQRRVDAAAARIGEVPAVPKVEAGAAVRGRGQYLDASGPEIGRDDRRDLISDMVELSRGSFEVKAGAKVARIQEEINDEVNRLGGRLDLYI